MAEGYLRAQVKQAIGLRGTGGLSPDLQPPGRSPQQMRLAGRLGRGHQQQPLGRGGKLLRAPQKAGFDPPWQRRLARQAEPAGQFRRGQVTRQLNQGERVAVRLGQYPLPHAVIEWPAEGRR